MAKHYETAAQDFLAHLMNRRFGTILADPPWQFSNRTGKMAPEHKRLRRYTTMTLQEIKELPVPEAPSITNCPQAIRDGNASWIARSVENRTAVFPIDSDCGATASNHGLFELLAFAPVASSKNSEEVNHNQPRCNQLTIATMLR